MEEKELNLDVLDIKFRKLKKTVNESVNLIICGLNFSNQFDFANANQLYALYFLNISLGFELLMKSMICYKEYKDKENFEINLKDYGHDLIKLRNKILENYKTLSQGRNPQEERMISELKEDCKFIHEDNELTKILEILSWYGLGGRYYNLDYITSKKIEKNKKNPEFEMDELILLEFLSKKDKNLYNKFTKPKDEDKDLSNTTEVWREVIQ